MTHLAIQEVPGGKAVEWLERVTDAEYNARTTATAGRPAAAAAAGVPSDAQKAFGDIAPALARYTDEVLFGDVWRRSGLSPRDRSLVTVSRSSPATAPTSCRSTSSARSTTVSAKTS